MHGLVLLWELEVELEQELKKFTGKEEITPTPTRF